MNTSYQKFLSISLKVAFVAVIVCSTAYLLMLGWYNNYVLDDYGFISDVDNEGVWGLTRNSYLQWQSRFSGFYVLGWIYMIWGHAGNLIGYTILMLLFGYATIHYALRNITSIRNQWLLWGISILVTNISIMAYFEISTFYWVCCALYTLSTYAAIVMIVAIFYSKGKLWLRWLAVVLSALYIGGGAENFTPIMIALFGLILLYQMIASKSWVFWKTTEQKMVWVSLVVMMVGFVAVIAGPGTKSRAATGGTQGYMEHFALVPYVVQLIKASVVFYMRLLSRGLYYVMLFPMGWMLGVKMKENGYVTELKSRKAVLVSVLIAFGAIELSIAASVYGMGWYAPLRAYCFVSFIVCALVIYCGVLYGLKKGGEKSAAICVVIMNILLASASTYFYKSEKPLVADVHGQIEHMYAQIEQHKLSGSTEPLVVEPIRYPYIPNSYAIMRTAINRIRGKSNTHIADPAEFFPYEHLVLTDEPDDFRNNGIRAWSNVEFDIITER